MSSPPYSDYVDYGSSSDSEQPFVPSSPPQRQTTLSQRPRPPRLSSPRLFQDIFTFNRPRDRPTLRQTQFRQSFRDFSRALTEANEAVQNAEQALRPTPVVDLTDSPPRQMAEPSGRASVEIRRHRDSWRREIALERAQQRMRQGDPSSHRRTPPNFLFPTHDLRHGPPTLEELRRDEDRAVQQQREARAQWMRQQTRSQPPPAQQPSSTPPHSAHGSTVTSEIESVDLTHVDDDSSLANALAKQRADAVKSQKSAADIPATARSTLTAYKCPICMETPRDATSTICGHLFCHRCIIDTLKWSEQQRTQDLARKSDGVCPVCRKVLKRKDKPDAKGRQLIPLQVKLVTKKVVKDVKGKKKATDVLGAREGSATPEAKVSVTGEGSKIGRKRRREESNEDEESMWLELTETHVFSP